MSADDPISHYGPWIIFLIVTLFFIITDATDAWVVGALVMAEINRPK
jgi:hypothetical protein